jgi:NADPH-dependent stearoyl-CoA 9-desaturase
MTSVSASCGCRVISHGDLVTWCSRGESVVSDHFCIALHGIHAAQNRPRRKERRARSRARSSRRSRVKWPRIPNFSSALRRSRRRRTMRERGRECCAHSVGVLGDFLWALSGRGGEVHRGRGRRGKQTGLVYPPILGTANFNVGPLLAFASRNLCYQIEHHLFSGLPSNRYAEIATRVRGCATTSTCPHHQGLLGQYMQTIRTI